MTYAVSDGGSSGHPLEQGGSRTASRATPSAIVVLAGILMIPAIWIYLVGYGVGTAIAVIGLYIAFAIPV